MSDRQDQSDRVIDELTAGPGGPPFETATPPAPAQPGNSGQRGMVRSIHYNISYVARQAERGGAGAIVLLHDLPGGAFSWNGVLPGLDATGRAIYAFDMLAFGASDHPWPSDTSIWGHADSLKYAIEALGLSNIVLAGIGQGGAVAQVLATRLLFGSVERLVLINSYAYQHAYAADWPLPEMEKRHDPDAGHHTRADALMTDLRNTLPNASAKPRALTGDRLAAYVDPWNSDAGKQLLFQHIRLMTPLYLNAVGSDLRKLAIPVLLIWGENDPVTPLALGKRLAAEIPGARFEIIGKGSHLLLDDEPGKVTSLIAGFIPAR